MQMQRIYSPSCRYRYTCRARYKYRYRYRCSCLPAVRQIRKIDLDFMFELKFTIFVCFTLFREQTAQAVQVSYGYCTANKEWGEVWCG